MQPPPALPQLINSAEGWLCTTALLASPPPPILFLDDDGGQIQGSGAEDLPTALPGLAYQSVASSNLLGQKPGAWDGERSSTRNTGLPCI